VLGLSILSATVAELIWPDASLGGIGAPQSVHVQISALPGFWLTLIGALALLAAAATRTRLDRSAAAPYRTTAPTGSSI
jgi:hypothetical protein